MARPPLLVGAFCLSLLLCALPWRHAPQGSASAVGWLLLGLVVLLCLHGAALRQSWAFNRHRSVFATLALCSLAHGMLYFQSVAGLSENLGFPHVSLSGYMPLQNWLGQRNLLATLAVIGIACLIIPFPQSHPLRLGLLLLAVAVAHTSSRTGFVGLFTLLCLVYGLGRRQRDASADGRPGLALLVGAVYLGATVWLGYASPSQHGVMYRFSEAVDCGSRLTLWSNVLTLISQKPWLGWGWNELDYAHFITLYPGERFCDILDNAHNLPLHLAVELGVPVALAFCTVLVWWVARNKPWRETDATRQTCWAILMVIGIHSLLEYPLWYAPFQLSTLVCLLILWQTRPDKAATPALFLRIASVLVRGRLWIGACLLLAGTVAAWNYHVVSQIYLPAEERAAAYRLDTLDKVQGTLLFQNHALFAKLTLTPLTLDNAASINALAKKMLHHSPEPRVIEPLVESAVLLGRQDEALFYLQRYQAAFPAAHAQWVERKGLRASSASTATRSP